LVSSKRDGNPQRSTNSLEMGAKTARKNRGKNSKIIPFYRKRNPNPQDIVEGQENSVEEIGTAKQNPSNRFHSGSPGRKTPETTVVALEMAQKSGSYSSSG